MATTLWAASAAGALLLTGCSSASTASDASASATTAPMASAVAGGSGTGSCPVRISDAWVKAADSGMTAAFGTLTNPTAEAVVVNGGSSAAAGMVELHETVNGVMQPAPDGFTVPANGEFPLAPGANHIMLMNIPAPITAGSDVTVTLTCGDGTSMEFTAQAKTFAGAAESYMPAATGSASAMSGM